LLITILAATVSLGMAENSTVKAAVSFLSSFIGQSREMEPLQAVVQAQGEDLLRKILACIGNAEFEIKKVVCLTIL